MAKRKRNPIDTWPTPINCRKSDLGMNLKLLEPKSYQPELKAMKEDPVLMKLLSDVKRDFGELGGFYFNMK